MLAPVRTAVLAAAAAGATVAVPAAAAAAAAAGGASGVSVPWWLLGCGTEVRPANRRWLLGVGGAGPGCRAGQGESRRRPTGRSPSAGEGRAGQRAAVPGAEARGVALGRRRRPEVAAAAGSELPGAGAAAPRTLARLGAPGDPLRGAGAAARVGVRGGPAGAWPGSKAWVRLLAAREGEVKTVRVSSCLGDKTGAER